MKKDFLIIAMLMLAARLRFHTANGFYPFDGNDEVSTINATSHESNVLENTCRSCKWRK